MCKRRCNCNLKSCLYCKERKRYEVQRENFLHRSRLQYLDRKFLKRDVDLVLSDFVSGRISLKELELIIDG